MHTDELTYLIIRLVLSKIASLVDYKNIVRSST